MTVAMETRALLLFLSLLNVLMTCGTDPTPAPTSSLQDKMERSTSRQDTDFSTMSTMEKTTGSKSSRTPSPSPSVKASTVVPTTSPPPAPPSETGPPSPASDSKSWLLAVLLLIVALAVFVGCVHCLWQRRAHGDGTTPMLLLDMRERLRTGIGNLEDRLGVQLWPGDKSAEEDEEDVEEGGRDKEEDEGQLTKVEDERGHEEDDSETSSEDNSSMEGGDGRVVALDSLSPERNPVQVQVQVQQNTSGEKIKDSSGSSQEEGQENTQSIDVTAL